MFNAGVRGKRAKDSTGLITVGEHFNQQNFLVPTVTRFAVTDGSYVDTNDTAADPAGNQVIVLYGSGFAPGATVLVGSTTIGAVTFLDSGRLTFSSPALGSGSYTVFVTNANGGTGILVPGLVYSGLPTFTTSAGTLGSVYETTAISTSVVATGDAPITYALSSGSLPSGSTLSSGGTISGTAPVDGSSTTYSFTVQATDAQNQDSVRSFSLTINTDVVSFSSPANNTTTTATQNTAISNVTVTATSAAGYGVLYTSSGLPTGLSMNTSTGIISGTPTVVASNTSIITATANTTTRTAALYLNWTINLPGDAFWKYASLLMSANTVPNGNTFITDLSTFNNEIIVVADTKPSEFHPFKEGYYSNYFDNTGDYLTIPHNTALDLWVGDFTIECWVFSNANQTNYDGIITKGGGTDAGWQMVVVSNAVNVEINGSTLFFSPSTTLPNNIWVHLAIVKSGTNVSLFQNGTRISAITGSSSTYSTTNNVYIGADRAAGNFFNGYISNVRLVKGTAVYDPTLTTLTPPTPPLTAIANTSLLTCQSNKLIDNSNNNFTITKNGDTTVNPFSPFNGTPTTITVPGANNYSVYFDGTGDYLTIPTNTAFQFGTGDFTVEAWIYVTSSAAAEKRILVNWNQSTNGYQFYLRTNNRLVWQLGNQNSPDSAALQISINTWTHVAFSKSGSNMYTSINGVIADTTTCTNSANGTGSNLAIGSDNAGLLYFTGYISNFRILKGTALYTSTFTPSTTPLTAIANTSLLLCQANTIIDSNNAYTITTNGNATPARNGPFANTTTVTLVGNEGSAYFDGTGDYLDAPSANTSGIFAFGTADYTLEAWIYPTATTAGMRVFEFSGNQDNIGINQTSTGTIDYYNGSASTTSAAGLVIVNSWTHIALVRQSGTAKVYVNGALAVTQASTPNTTARALWIGGRNNTIFQGYMSNVRVTKGTALYTTPFVPSFAPLTPVANTVLLTAQTNLSSNTKVIVDESNLNNIVSGFGNSNLGTFSPFGSSRSVYFDGTGDYLSGSSSRLNFGANDFTVEFWMWPVNISTNSQIIFQAGSGNLAILLMTGGIIEPGQYQTAGISSSTAVITAGAWHHVVLTRTGTAFRTIINGVLRGYGTRSFSPNNSSYTIGGAASGTSYTGYISNFRVFANNIPTLYSTASTTLATTIFTTPTDPFVSDANTVLLTCNSNQFVDYSAANNVITRTGDAAVSEFSPFSSVTVTPASYSGYFDGTGDYLSVPYNVALNLSTGAPNFTVEAWFNIPALIGSSQCIISKDWQAGSTNASYALALQQNGQFFYFFGNGTNASYSQQYSYTIPGGGLGAWNHVAMVRNSSNMLCFFNGALVQTIAITGTMVDAGNPVFIGMTQNSSEVLTNGYVSNARIVKGTAVYTATFTPPTAPLTAISGTSLLTCQSTTFVDTSNNAFAITVNGNAKPVRQNPFTDTVSTASNYSANTFGNSVYFDGTTDYLTIPYNSIFNIPASTPFTLEGWAYTTATTEFHFANRNWAYGSSGPTYAFYLASGTTPNWQIGGTGSSTYNMMVAGIPGKLGQWNHYAWTRDSSNVCRIFTNGEEAVSSTRTDSQALTSASGSMFIGVSSNLASNYTNGYLSNLRFVVGSCTYTRAFVPSNQPLPVTSNTTLLLASTVGPSTTDATRNHNIETFGTARRVANNSPYYDTYSAYFDGSGDYLSFSSNSAFGFGTGDFTVEYWVYSISWATAPTVVDLRTPSGSSLQWSDNFSAGGAPGMYYNATQVLTSSITIPLRTWAHVAYTREGSTVKVWVNGVQGATGTSSFNLQATGGFSIGTNNGNANPFNGYVSNIRILKGTALYTTTFTPSTTPLTAIANTSLLTCQSNRFIDNSTNAFTITKAGDAKITAFEPFANSNNSRYNSVYYATKTDYLGIRPQPNVITFPGDFTFECWVYPTDTSLSTAWGIWDSRQNGATAAAMSFGLAALASPVTGSWRLTYYNGTSYYGTGTVLWNQWTHVAWVRSGTTMTFYVNGIAGGTATISGTQTGTATTNPIYIGIKDNGLANYGTVGYIADFRITNGYARTITLPTAPYDIK